MSVFLKSKKCFLSLLLALMLMPRTEAMIDDNGNGVSDVWEQLHGPLVDPDEDDDHDGSTNVQESQAGTDPNDPQDHPRVSELHSEGPSELRNRFPSIAGIHYQFYVSPDLQSWFPIGIPQRGSGNVQDVTFSLDDTQSTGKALLSKWTNVTNGNLNTIKGYAGSGSPAPSLTQETLVVQRCHQRQPRPPRFRHAMDWLSRMEQISLAAVRPR